MNSVLRSAVYSELPSCKLPVDTGFEKQTIFGMTLQFVVIVGKQTRGESAPICRTAVNDSAALGIC